MYIFFLCKFILSFICCLLLLASWFKEKIFEQEIQFFTGVFDCTLCVLSFDYLAGTCFKWCLSNGIFYCKRCRICQKPQYLVFDSLYNFLFLSDYYFFNFDYPSKRSFENYKISFIILYNYCSCFSSSSTLFLRTFCTKLCNCTRFSCILSLHSATGRCYWRHYRLF